MKTINTETRMLATVSFVTSMLLFVGCGNENVQTTPKESVQTVSVDTASPQPEIESGTYAMDPAHSSISFRIKHLGISTVTGTFGESNATVTVGENGLSNLEAQAEISVASIDTDDGDRDDHLRSADFFDSEIHPTISFRSTGIEGVDGDQFNLLGNLTIKETTLPVVLEAQYMGSAIDPWGNQKVGFSALTKIDREDFGLRWNKVMETGGFLVGKEVTLQLEVQAVKQ